MRHKKWVKRGVVLCAVLLLSVGFCMRFVAVNRAWPNPDLALYSVGEPFLYHNCELTGIKVEIGEYQQMLSARQAEVQEEFSPFVDGGEPGEKELVLATVRFQNTGTEEVQIDLTYFVMQFGNDVNGLSIGLLDSLNPPDGVPTTLRLVPGQTQEVCIPFTVMESFFKPGEWKNRREVPYWMVLSLYPEKVALKLQ